MILKFILLWLKLNGNSPFPSLGSAVLTRRQKEKEPSAVYFLSVNSDCLKIKVNKLSNIIIKKAGLLFIFRLSTTAFRLAYIWFCSGSICYFVVTDLYGNLKKF